MKNKYSFNKHIVILSKKNYVNIKPLLLFTIPKKPRLEIACYSL